MLSENVVKIGALVIEGGIAGCFAAIRAREQGGRVTMTAASFPEFKTINCDPGLTTRAAVQSKVITYKRKGGMPLARLQLRLPTREGGGK